MLLDLWPIHTAEEDLGQTGGGRSPAITTVGAERRRRATVDLHLTAYAIGATGRVAARTTVELEPAAGTARLRWKATTIVELAGAGVGAGRAVTRSAVELSAVANDAEELELLYLSPLLEEP